MPHTCALPLHLLCEYPSSVALYISYVSALQLLCACPVPEHALHLLCTCSAPAQYPHCTCSTPTLHLLPMLCSCCASASHLPSPCSPALCLFCACTALALRLLCTCSAPALYLLCTRLYLLCACFWFTFCHIDLLHACYLPSLCLPHACTVAALHLFCTTALRLRCTCSKTTLLLLRTCPVPGACLP
jgi:hypothetical protein